MSYREDDNRSQAFASVQDSALSHMPVGANFGLEASLGNLSGYATVNKFGQASDCDSGVLTDIWDGADGTTSTDVWAPPNAARIHTIVSASDADSDTGGSNPQSTGARTMRVWYLADWDTAEATEDIILDGTAGVAMTNAAVMIHRMRCLTWGSGGVNAGIIKATAATDSTVTAAILAGSNQTQMVIYGVPSTQKLRVSQFCVEILKTAGGSVKASGEVLVMPAPATNAATNTAWINKENFSVNEAVGPWKRPYPESAPKKFDGPCILKIQVNADTNNSVCTASFDGTLVDN